MKSFPKIQRQIVINCFNSIVDLYIGDQVKLLEAAESSTIDDKPPFVKTAGDIPPQIEGVRNRVQRIADNYGRDALIKWIERLRLDLLSNGGAIGVTLEDFLARSSLPVDDGVTAKLIRDGKWIIEWSIPMFDDMENIRLQIRDSVLADVDIVPDYIIQYVNQAILAYKKKNYLTSLSMISIALEGTLRDVLEVKGFTYIPGAPSEDTYEFSEMEISPDPTGFKVIFLTPTARPFTDFLIEPGALKSNKVRLKRIKRQNKFCLEVRDVDYLKDYWSSDIVIGVGHKNIGGLGTALKVARYDALILNSSILPEDTDEVIQQVRNNLIHLSGNAMLTPIASVGISLEEFASDQARVFDAIWSISGAIDKLYSKKASGTL